MTIFEELPGLKEAQEENLLEPWPSITLTQDLYNFIIRSCLQFLHEQKTFFDDFQVRKCDVAFGALSYGPVT